MIVFGTHETSPDKINYIGYKGIRSVMVFNLSSLYQLGEQLFALIPNPLPDVSILESDQIAFDVAYMNYVIGNDQAFMELMKIMYPTYENSPTLLVYILIGNDPYKDMITESLIKLIQQRYSYNCNRINTIDDISCIEDSDMNIYGLYNFDQDKERLVGLIKIPIDQDLEG